MPRRAHSILGDYVYHVLNRSNARAKRGGHVLNRSNARAKREGGKVGGGKVTATKLTKLGYLGKKP